jgi:membrane-associated phospholipid phosphatase
MTTQQRWRFLLPAGLVLAAIAALAVDVPIAQAFRVWDGSPAIHELLDGFDRFELFGHGFGVLIIVVVLHQLDPARRWAIPRVALCAFAGGGLADLLKMLIVRSRPYEFAFDGSVWDTFGAWFPGINAISGEQSFPSAHTATAVALAAALVWLYPKGRWLFPTLAVLVGCQRIVSGVHFPSDVFVGAALGCLTAQWFLGDGFLARRFDRWEAGWRGDEGLEIRNG